MGNSAIVGVIVAKLCSEMELDAEDKHILKVDSERAPKYCYILTLGVSAPFRRQGIARSLISYLTAALASSAYFTCQAIFLHVLADNISAIRMYERFGFSHHALLPRYYTLPDQQQADACTYVLYINGGVPPSTIWGDARELFQEAVVLARRCFDLEDDDGCARVLCVRVLCICVSVCLRLCLCLCVSVSVKKHSATISMQHAHAWQAFDMPRPGSLGLGSVTRA